MRGSPAVHRGRLAVIAALLLAVILWSLLGDGPRPADVKAAVQAAGGFAPVLFVALYVALTVLVVPGVVLTVASGVLFGPVFGTLLAVVGATAGASAAYGIARRLGRVPVGSVSGPRMARLNRWLSRRGFLAVLYARLVPIVPFNAFNYAAGLTDVRPRDYVAATAVGIVPGAFAYAALGGSLHDPRSATFLAAVALVALVAGLGTMAARRSASRTGKERIG